jgi:capsular polysaccharide transport system ATP-binding protein
MIRFEGVTARVAAGARTISVLEDASFNLPSDQHLVVLGQEGSGKTTLIRLLSGALLPDAGRIARHVRVSFPVGFTGGYRRNLSVRENIAHVARLYGTDADEVVDFVDRIAELGSALDQDFSELPQPLRLRLAYAVSYAIPFDTYLIDTRTVMGDSQFRARCERLFEARLQGAGFVFTTSNARAARRIGRMAAILHGGRLTLYAEFERALWEFERLPPVAARVAALAEVSE